MSWTDERVALLKKLWGEGKTAAEIASELGGVTRNAVIGKAHRLKLSGRVSPIQQNNKKPAPAKPAPEKKAEPRAAVESPADCNRPRRPLVELGPRDCRWPLGDPREEHFGFCGEKAEPGLPYCAEHARAAYQTAVRNRVLKAEDFEDKSSGDDEAQDDTSRIAVNQ